jgi:hypothetical protein
LGYIGTAGKAGDECSHFQNKEETVYKQCSADVLSQEKLSRGRCIVLNVIKSGPYIVIASICQRDYGMSVSAVYSIK